MDADQIEVYLRKRKFKSRLEEAYANHDAWCYEDLKFRLGPSSWYMPDFIVIVRDDEGRPRPHAMEVKGSWKAPNQAVSRTKIKACSAKYPCIRWFGVTYEAPKGWVYEEIK
jgi:hypothetical protein